VGKVCHSQKRELSWVRFVPWFHICTKEYGVLNSKIECSFVYDSVPFCKPFLVTFSRILVMFNRKAVKLFMPHLLSYGVKMMTVFKFLVGALLGAFAWLVTGYTVEYFRPYKPAKRPVRKD